MIDVLIYIGICYLVHLGVCLQQGKLTFGFFIAPLSIPVMLGIYWASCGKPSENNSEDVDWETKMIREGQKLMHK